jgi:hypothetical protein
VLQIGEGGLALVAALEGVEAKPERLGNLTRVYRQAGEALEAARSEITRLLEETGDPAARMPWPPISEYRTEPDNDNEPRPSPDEPGDKSQ